MSKEIDLSFLQLDKIMKTDVYDQNENEIVDIAESVEGSEEASDNTFYGKIDGSTGFYDFEQLDLNIESIGDIDDVSLIDIENGDILQWDGSQFVPTAFPESGATEINELSDVNIDGIEEDQYLRWNGSEFVADNLPEFSGVESIDDLNDVDIAGIEEDQYLRWDGSQFVAATLPEGNGGAESLDDLSDVSLSSVEEGQFLRYDGSNFINETVDVDKLDSISVVDPEDGYALIYNSSSEQFEPQELPEGGSSIESIGELNDVDIVGIEENQYLRWDGSQFVADDLPEGNGSGVESINDLSDVNVSDLEEGQILEYDGSEFVNVSYDLDKLDDFNTSGAEDGQILVFNDSNSQFEPQNMPEFESGATELNELSDVSVSELEEGQFLRYDGSEFVNETVEMVSEADDLDDVSTDGVEDGQILVYNASEGRFEPQNAPEGTTPELEMGDLIDFDESVTPEDGFVVQYDAASEMYIPAAIDTSGSGNGKNGPDTDATTVRREVIFLQWSENNNIHELTPLTSGVEVEVVEDRRFYVTSPVHKNPPIMMSYWTFGGTFSDWDDEEEKFVGGRYFFRLVDEALHTGFLRNRDSSTVYTKDAFGNYNLESESQEGKQSFYHVFDVDIDDLNGSHVTAFVPEEPEKWCDSYLILIY